ncbi:putative membrane protein [Collimonas pratensis]|uniref:Membrane protein n=1 Tax=Collimonas pratensis TaxID=279113 RepID=A0A127QUL9_9BURK|nr:putative membrane protein [Collimonas pratensis]AMP13611.1 putative membrane protein [Collimonas pratensis]
MHRRYFGHPAFSWIFASTLLAGVLGSLSIYHQQLRST